MSIIREKEAQIRKLQDDIKDIQDECSHPDPAVIKTNKADKDNYDRPDRFWIANYCSLCHKRWEAESSR